MNGDSYSDQNGELTEIGEIWVHEIEKLHPSQIMIGMTNLRYKPNAQFAPSAVEFSAFCLSFSATECASEILEHIQNDNHWWVTEEAFNVYINLGYSPARNQADSKIVEDVKRVYMQLDLNNLKPIPEKAIEIPRYEPSKVERGRSGFQALMNKAIKTMRPDMLGSQPKKQNYPANTRDFLAKFAETKRPPEELVSFICEMKGVETDPLVTSTFTPHKSNELIINWYQQKQPDMTDFLRNEGFAI